MAEVNAPAAAPAAAAHASPPASAATPAAAVPSPSWAIKALARSTATNVDMALFRFLFTGGAASSSGDGDEIAASAAADDAAVLRALAPLRHASLLFGWQRRLARRALEHPRKGAPGVVNFVVARQRWFDAQLSAALLEQEGGGGGGGGGIEQVVALAAGYELRARRFQGRGARGGGRVAFFEVDLPRASAKKRALVARLPALASGGGSGTSSDAVRYVPCDLSEPGQLRARLVAAGFEPERPTLFTAEGLAYYLSADAAAGLVREVGALAAEAARAGAGAGAGAASRLALDYLHEEALRAGWAAGIAGGAPAGGDTIEGKKKRESKKGKAPPAAAAAAAAPLPRAYAVTARSVAAKGEPFLSGAPASPLGAAAWLASASGGALALKEHSTTRAAAEALLGAEAVREHDVLSFYSFVVAEAAGPVPPSPLAPLPGAQAGGGGFDAVARVA
jgi:methyltransferase (TIGR00027 family)